MFLFPGLNSQIQVKIPQHVCFYIFVSRFIWLITLQHNLSTAACLTFFLHVKSVSFPMISRSFRIREIAWDLYTVAHNRHSCYPYHIDLRAVETWPRNNKYGFSISWYWWRIVDLWRLIRIPFANLYVLLTGKAWGVENLTTIHWTMFVHTILLFCFIIHIWASDVSALLWCSRIILLRFLLVAGRLSWEQQ